MTVQKKSKKLPKPKIFLGVARQNRCSAKLPSLLASRTRPLPLLLCCAQSRDIEGRWALPRGPATLGSFQQSCSWREKGAHWLAGCLSEAPSRAFPRPKSQDKQEGSQGLARAPGAHGSQPAAGQETGISQPPPGMHFARPWATML